VKAANLAAVRQRLAALREQWAAGGAD